MKTPGQRDEAARIIPGRSWGHPTEWITPLLILVGGIIAGSVCAVLGKPFRGPCLAAMGCLAMERLFWSAHRVWWRLRQRRDTWGR